MTGGGSEVTGLSQFREKHFPKGENADGIIDENVYTEFLVQLARSKVLAYESITEPSFYFFVVIRGEEKWIRKLDKHVCEACEVVTGEIPQRRLWSRRTNKIWLNCPYYPVTREMALTILLVLLDILVSVKIDWKSCIDESVYSAKMLKMFGNSSLLAINGGRASEDQILDRNGFMRDVSVVCWDEPLPANQGIMERYAGKVTNIMNKLIPLTCIVRVPKDSFLDRLIWFSKKASWPIPEDDEMEFNGDTFTLNNGVGFKKHEHHRMFLQQCFPNDEVREPESISRIEGNEYDMYELKDEGKPQLNYRNNIDVRKIEELLGIEPGCWSFSFRRSYIRIFPQERNDIPPECDEMLPGCSGDHERSAIIRKRGDNGIKLTLFCHVCGKSKPIYLNNVYDFWGEFTYSLCPSCKQLGLEPSTNTYRLLRYSEPRDRVEVYCGSTKIPIPDKIERRCLKMFHQRKNDIELVHVDEKSDRKFPSNVIGEHPDGKYYWTFSEDSDDEETTKPSQESKIYTEFNDEPPTKIRRTMEESKISKESPRKIQESKISNEPPRKMQESRSQWELKQNPRLTREEIMEYDGKSMVGKYRTSLQGVFGFLKLPQRRPLVMQITNNLQGPQKLAKNYAKENNHTFITSYEWAEKNRMYLSFPSFDVFWENRNFFGDQRFHELIWSKEIHIPMFGDLDLPLSEDADAEEYLRVFFDTLASYFTELGWGELSMQDIRYTLHVGQKDGHRYLSSHFIVQNGKRFVNVCQHEEFAEGLETFAKTLGDSVTKFLFYKKTNRRGEVTEEFMLDLAPYHENKSLRCLESHKYNSGRVKQVEMEHYNPIEYFITPNYDAPCELYEYAFQTDAPTNRRECVYNENANHEELGEIINKMLGFEYKWKWTSKEHYLRAEPLTCQCLVTGTEHQNRKSAVIITFPKKDRIAMKLKCLSCGTRPCTKIPAGLGKRFYRAVVSKLGDIVSTPIRGYPMKYFTAARIIEEDNLSYKYGNPFFTMVETWYRSKGTLFVKSPMDTRKTSVTVTIINELFLDSKILWVTHRQVFSRVIASKFGYLGAVCYLDKQNDGKRVDLTDNKFVICCVNSLNRLASGNRFFPKWDLVIIDESESVLDHCMGETLNERRTILLTYLKTITETTPYVIAMDADMCDRSYLALKFDRKTYKVINKITKMKREFIIHNDMKQLTNNILQCLKNGEKIVIASMSSKQAEVINQLVLNNTNKKVLLHIADGPDDIKEQLGNVNDLWTQYDCVIYSPQIDVGCDFHEVHFHKMFVVICSGSVGPRQLLQMTGRVRKLHDNQIHCYCSTGISEGGAWDISSPDDYVRWTEKNAIDVGKLTSCTMRDYNDNYLLCETETDNWSNVLEGWHTWEEHIRDQSFIPHFKWLIESKSMVFTDAREPSKKQKRNLVYNFISEGKEGYSTKRDKNGNITIIRTLQIPTEVEYNDIIDRIRTQKATKEDREKNRFMCILQKYNLPLSMLGDIDELKKIDRDIGPTMLRFLSLFQKDDIINAPHEMQAKKRYLIWNKLTKELLQSLAFEYPHKAYDNNELRQRANTFFENNTLQYGRNDIRRLIKKREIREERSKRRKPIETITEASDFIKMILEPYGFQIKEVEQHHEVDFIVPSTFIRGYLHPTVDDYHLETVDFTAQYGIPGDILRAIEEDEQQHGDAMQAIE